jgi:hypothetical protein
MGPPVKCISSRLELTDGIRAPSSGNDPTWKLVILVASLIAGILLMGLTCDTTGKASDD